jgi:hypothetical protein
MLEWVGRARTQAAGIAGEDVVQRRSLAEKAMMGSLDARSQHDLGPYDAAARWRRCGFLADGWGRNCGLIVEPPRRSR